MRVIFLSVIVVLTGTFSSISGQSVHLQGIQSEIDKAFYASFASESALLLTEIANRLNQDSSSLVIYWRAYAKYYEAIFYLKTNQRDKSNTVLNEGIEALSKLENKKSEDYALLSLMQNLSMQFITDGMKLWKLSEEISGHIEKAIKLDSNNLRAYYVAASNDFYTPEQFGGGKKAEEYLLKAITLDTQPLNNAALPSWGKDQAYQMLINLYLKKENKELAKKYLEEAQSINLLMDVNIED